MDSGYLTIQEKSLPDSQCCWVPIHYWPGLVLLDWTITFWSAVCHRTTRELVDHPYIGTWNKMSKIWLKYHCRARDKVKAEAASLLPGSDSLKQARLPILDEWIARSCWGVHLICDEDLPLLRRALSVDILAPENKKEIGKSPSHYYLSFS